jgi:hypothetical protein
MTSARRSGFLILLIGFALLVGCTRGSRHMRPAPADAAYRPESHQALVVFVRPFSEYSQNQVSIFELASPEDELVGILAVRAKAAYLTTPGEHTFMLVMAGWDAGFMRARLDAGKTYYVLLEPGTEKSRLVITFAPVKGKDLRSERVVKAVEGSVYVENTPAAQGWAKSNARSIQGKKRAALPGWERLSEAEKLSLAPEDGM